jgi:serine protease Do
MILGLRTPLAFAAIFLAICAFVAAQEVPAKNQVSSPQRAELLSQLDGAFNGIVERALPAVVQIQVSGYGPPEHAEGDADTSVIQRQRAIGSGVIVEPDGYIMTNAHVVAGAQRIRVVLAPTPTELVEGKASFMRRHRVFDARLLGLDRKVDLALIKIDEKDLPYIPLKSDFRIQLGQLAVAIGSPEGLEHTVTRGIVSAAGRQLELDKPMVYIQTDAPINPGNSGGALIDRDGNLVGLNTFILTEGGGSEGLGFAIPEPVVRFVYHELRDHGHIRRSQIGAKAQTITPDLAAALHLPQDWGVIISDVIPDGPAEQAGLKPKDIVLSVNGRPIDSLPKFTISLYLHPREAPLNLLVQRGSELQRLSITPVSVQAGPERLSDLVDPKNLIVPLGVFLLDLDKSLADALPGLRSTSGVIVAGTVDYTPRLDADLEVGDVIRSMNGAALSNTNDLRTRLTQLKPGEPVVFEVEREGAFQFVTFEME